MEFSFKGAQYIPGIYRFSCPQRLCGDGRQRAQPTNGRTRKARSIPSQNHLFPPQTKPNHAKHVKAFFNSEVSCTRPYHCSIPSVIVYQVPYTIRLLYTFPRPTRAVSIDTVSALTQETQPHKGEIRNSGAVILTLVWNAPILK